MAGAWSSSSSPSQQLCASCKLLRRRCVKECIFAPYFPPDDPRRFAIVHRVFGASNVSRMLQELPVHQRADAVSSLVYEADARKKDPVYGGMGAISCLRNRVSQLQMQLAVARAKILCMQMQMQMHAAAAAASGSVHDFLYGQCENEYGISPWPHAAGHPLRTT